MKEKIINLKDIKKKKDKEKEDAVVNRIIKAAKKLGW